MMQQKLSQIASAVSKNSLESISTGFYFAAAVAWMDVIRAVLTEVIKVKNNSRTFFALTALLTTLVAVVASMGIAMIDKDVRRRRIGYAVR